MKTSGYRSKGSLELTNVLLTLSFYGLFFSNTPDYQVISQLGGIFLAACSAMVGFVGRGMPKKGLCLFEICVVLLGVSSEIVSWFNQIEFVSFYSIVFLMTVFVTIIMVRVIDLEEIISAAAYAYVGSVITIFVFDREGLMTSLREAGNIWEFKFEPLGLHPNLVGFVFGAGAMVLLAKASIVDGRGKWIYIGATIISVLFVIAASARASVLALLVSATILLCININRFGIKLVGGIFLSIFVFSVVNVETIYAYLYQILDLASEQRGIESGGSGRTELWQLGFDQILHQGWQLFSGGGLRSSEAEIIGFHTENSYITIVLDSGVIFGGLVIFTILLYVVRVFNLAYREVHGKSYFYNALLGMMLFVVIEFVFNRYLIGIGNPSSLLFMIVCAAVGLLRDEKMKGMINYTAFQTANPQTRAFSD